MATLAVAAVALVGGVGLIGNDIASRNDVRHVRRATETPLTAMDQSLGVANNSPLVVADPTEERFVVIANRLDAPDFGCALHVSGDGGRSWSPRTPVPKLPAGAEKCYAPEVAFDRSGLLHYLFVGLAGRGNQPTGAFLTTSSDHGTTFSRPRRVLGPLNFAVRMGIDTKIGSEGRLHLVWLHATSDPPLGGFGPPPNPILSAFSDDGGRTFSKPVQVSDARRPRAVAPALALGPDHTLHVAYFDLGADAVDYQGLEGPVWDGEWSVVLARSLDGGRSFRPGVTVDAGVVPSSRVMLIFTMAPPALVADGRGSCLAWTDARHGDDDIMLRCVPSKGRPTNLRRVNDDAVGNGRSQYLPRLSRSRSGRLDAVFYDRRNSVENLANELSYAYSLDNGQSFEPNARVTTFPSDPRIGQQYANVSAQGQVEIGSRLGLWSTPERVVVAWADTRNSRPATTGQDVFVANLEMVRAARWGRWAGGAAMAAGVIVLLVGRRRWKDPGP